MRSNDVSGGEALLSNRWRGCERSPNHWCLTHISHTPTLVLGAGAPARRFMLAAPLPSGVWVSGYRDRENVFEGTGVCAVGE